MKRWTYTQLTVTARASIKRGMYLDDVARSRGDSEIAQLHMASARGAYWLWRELTLGNSEAADDAEFAMLVKLSGHPAR